MTATRRSPRTAPKTDDEMEDEAPLEVRNGDLDANANAIENGGELAGAGAALDPSKKRKRNKKKSKSRNRSDSTSSAYMDTSTDSEESEEPPRKRQTIAKASRKKPPPPTQMASPKQHGQHTIIATEGAAASVPNLSTPVLRAPPAFLLHEPDPNDDQELSLPPSNFSPVNQEQNPLFADHTDNINDQSFLDCAPAPAPPASFPPLPFIPEQEGEQPVHDNTDAKPFRFRIPSIHGILLTLSWTYVASVLLWALLLRTPPIRPSASNTNTTSTDSPACFRNNVHSPVKYQGVCSTMDPSLFSNCPRYALCFGGSVSDCQFGGKSLELQQGAKDYYQWNGHYCEPTKEVEDTLKAIVDTLESWTLAHACREGQHSTNPNQYPEPAWTKCPTAPLFVLTQVTEQLLTRDDLPTLPFDVRHPLDAYTFVSQLSSDNDNDFNLILSAMPSQIAPQTRSRRGWFGGRRFQQSSLALMDKPYIAAGTPLIGLSSHGATSKAFWPLWLQCWWQGLPRGSNRSAPTSSGASQATVQQEEGNSTVVNDTTKSPERGSTTNFTKAQTASTPKDQQAKQEPSVKKKLMLNVKPDKKMTKSKMGMAKAGNNTGPLRAIGQRILLPVTTLLASRSSNATTIPSSSYSQSGAHYWYPTLSSIGVVVVLVLYYLQYQSKLEKSWIPEIARIKELALKYIQTATNGGWHLMHLRDAVLQAEQDVHGTERRHLERDIWPRVLRQLQADDRIARSDVPSPTGKRQTIISWVGEKNVEKSANEGLPSMDQHVTFEDTA